MIKQGSFVQPDIFRHISLNYLLQKELGTSTDPLLDDALQNNQWDNIIKLCEQDYDR